MSSQIPCDTSTSAGTTRFHWGKRPSDLLELSARADDLAGVTLGELADDAQVPTPLDLKRAKGWVGVLLEKALGASAGSRALPDFPELGVELKTLPIDPHGKPLESTFVCTIEMREIADTEWEAGRLLAKLRHVLWVPIEGSRDIPIARRRIATPFFWKPSAEQQALLRTDWEALTLMISQGRTAEITGHLGEVLQVRPKAARGASRRRVTDSEGSLYDEQPKGFYLRPSFTRSLLLDNYSRTSL